MQEHTCGMKALLLEISHLHELGLILCVHFRVFPILFFVKIRMTLDKQKWSRYETKLHGLPPKPDITLLRCNQPTLQRKNVARGRGAFPNAERVGYIVNAFCNRTVVRKKSPISSACLCLLMQIDEMLKD